MANKKVVIAVVTLLLLIVPIAIAQDFDVSITPIKNKIMVNESAFYRLMVSNNKPTIQRYSIYTPDVEWTFVTEPSLDYVIKVYPNSYTETTLVITPYVFTRPGLYGVNVNIKALDGTEMTSKKLLVEIVPGEDNSFVPSIKMTPHIPESIDPRQQTKLTVDLQNLRSVGIPQLELSIQSKLFKKSYNTSLAPLEKKSIDFFIELDPLQAPMKDVLRLSYTAKVSGRVFKSDSFPYNYAIAGYGNLVQTESPTTGFLTRTKTITLFNDGNQQNEFAVRIKRTLAGMLLTSYNPKPRVIKPDDGSYYSWPIVLGAQKTGYIEAKVHYWPIVIIALLAIIIVALYFILRSPLLVVKSTQVLSTKNGGIAEIAVQMDIKNRGNRLLRNVHIIDKLPNLLDCRKEVKPGVVIPDSVLKHEKKGTILKWGLGSLEPYEERVITYKAVSRLSIIGGLNLPATYANFEQKSGVESSTSSNHLRLRV